MQSIIELCQAIGVALACIIIMCVVLAGFATLAIFSMSWFVKHLHRSKVQ